MLLFVLSCCFLSAFGTEFTLPGECPEVKVHENLDYTEFSGTWYNTASYASDGRTIHDCAQMDFQEDNLGYTLRGSYVEIDQGNSTQKWYFARVDPTFDAGNKAKFIVSYESEGKVLQFPFVILSTDYKNYAIAYICKTYKSKSRTHYLYTWILSRTKDNLGELPMNVQSALSRYLELSERRSSFVYINFDEEKCAYTNKQETDFFTNYYL